MRPDHSVADSPESPATPWWRVGLVWLVLSGPVAVIVAGALTMVLAWQHSDPVVSEVPEQKIDAPHSPRSPAMQARNHAASPIQRTQTP